MARDFRADGKQPVPEREEVQDEMPSQKNLTWSQETLQRSPQPSEPDGSSVSGCLKQWSEGNPDALNRLMPLIYHELRRLAHAYLRRERHDHTLETSALIHEAYMRLIGQREICCLNTHQFLAIAARTMRCILVDHARSRDYQKRGGGMVRVSLEDMQPLSVEPPPWLIDLDEALEKLAEVSPQQAQVVELRYFGGLGSEDIAAILGISIPTVTRRWRVARAWLYRFMTGSDAPPGQEALG